MHEFKSESIVSHEFFAVIFGSSAQTPQSAQRFLISSSSWTWHYFERILDFYYHLQTSQSNAGLSLSIIKHMNDHHSSSKVASKSLDHAKITHNQGSNQFSFSLQIFELSFTLFGGPIG